MEENMKIALIAHDKKKTEMIDFVKDNEALFSKQELYGTGTTGKLIMENTNLKVTRLWLYFLEILLQHNRMNQI